jgi:uncharacterized protein YcbK (DUF882 family)
MMKIGMLEAARPARVGKIGTGARIFSLLVLGCSAASAAAFIYPAKIPTADVVRIAPGTEMVQVATAPAPAKVVTRLASASAAWTSPAPSEVTPARAPVRQIPLIAGVDPTPPAPSKAGAPQVATASTSVTSQAQSAPVQAVSPAQTVIAASAKAPVDCLPEGLRTVLQNVQARFGTVALVSTLELHTDNHSPGTARHKMHSACKAVDFKVEGDLTAVTAYLRSRPEVSGVNSYRNNRVIHIDAAEGRKLAQR